MTFLKSTIAMTTSEYELRVQKQQMRHAAYAVRDAQPDKDRVSGLAIARFVQLPEYQRAGTVMWYLHIRSELRTRQALPAALDSGKRIVIPYCTVDEQGDKQLGLWWLESLDELTAGTWNILEPPRERWGEPGKEVDPLALDMVMVPGVAFGRNGARLGNGQGYYDRLLRRVRPDCSRVAVCYECQVFDDLIVAPHDVLIDKVVTEQAIYQRPLPAP
jgi:5-formyltetrahydrofolate cyclo-ligase